MYFVTWLTCCVLFGSAAHTEVKIANNFVLDDLKKVLEALNKVVVTVTKQGDGANVDVITGISMMKDQLQDARKHLDVSGLSGTNEWTDVDNHLKTLIEHAELWVAECIEKNRQEDNDYYENFKPMLTRGHWVVPDAGLSRLPDGSRLNITYSQWLRNDIFDEDTSDACISSLWKNESFDGNCLISLNCWEEMIEKKTRGYSLTHQLLFKQLAVMFGCRREMEKMAVQFGHSSLKNVTAYLCARIYQDFVYLGEKIISKENEDAWDLFLEEGLVCGMEGFQNFITPDWVQRVISRQSRKGCFDGHPQTSSLTLSLEERYDVIIADDCSGHLLAVASGYLGVSANHIVQTVTRTNTPYHVPYFM